MKPVTKLPRTSCRKINAVFSDLDDTLTLAGRIPPQAYRSLWRLRKNGITIVIVTGRPSGWADALLRLMPVNSVVAENGAVTLACDEAAGTIKRTYALAEGERRNNRKILDGICRKILEKMPGLRLAADQIFRETDIAFDICEDVDHLDSRTIELLTSLIEAEGLTYKISSIHVNAWIGTYDKKAACKRLLKSMGRNSTKTIVPLFIGDSPNDEPLFGSFKLSVGVANVNRFARTMKHLPAYVTDREGGAGFSEMADHILKNRR
ncbi:MAG: HAD family hydrolase [Pseudomonadota bacterium]